MNIAKEHLIPKQLKKNGLNKDQFRISEVQIRFLIRHYTREAGVRQLERVIASLCRKTVVAILKDGEESVSITQGLIQEWLGKKLYEYGKKRKKTKWVLLQDLLIHNMVAMSCRLK